MLLSMMGEGPATVPVNIQVLTGSLSEGNLTLTPPTNAPYANILWAQIRLYAIGAGGGGGSGGPANTVFAGGGGGGGGSGNIVSYVSPYFWNGLPWVQAGLPGDGGNLVVRGGKSGSASVIQSLDGFGNTITLATAAGGGGGFGGTYGTGGGGGTGLYTGSAGQTVDSSSLVGGNGGAGGTFATYVPVNVPSWGGAGGFGGHGQDKPSGSGNVGVAGNQGWGYYEITYALPS